MGTTVRRVVTGWDANGKSIITSDGPTPVVHTNSMRPGFSSSEVWVTDGVPAKTRETHEPTDRPRSIEPPTGGTVCRIAELPPDTTWHGKIDRAKAVAAYAEFGSKHAVDGNENAPHPFMHKTETVDYGIVLSGEIWMVMDDTETLLRAGDVAVQRGTNHAWSNRSKEVCRMAFILIDGTWKA
jgi:hypothetical protein